MSNSIKYDNTEILTTAYGTRFAKHESATERELNFLSLARDDGAVLVSDKRGVKTIFLEGVLTATDKDTLDSAIDSFKELFSRQNKNLDISWNSSTRRYVANCVNHNFNREHFNLNFVPWTAEFVVFSGVGKDTTITAEKNAVSVNDNPYAWKSTFAGSAEPKPLITLLFGAGHTAPRGIELKNTDNDQRLVYNKQSGVLVNGDSIVFDLEEKKVTRGGAEEGFYGLFPEMIVGDNNLQIKIGNIIDQESTPPASPTESVLIYEVAGVGKILASESFVVPYKDKTYRNIYLYIKKNGTPPNPLSVRIETDDGGEPSGSLVSVNAYGTISEGIVSTSWGWCLCTLNADIELEANTPYWIVLEMADGASGNSFEISSFSKNYLKGNNAVLNPATSLWVDYPTKNLGFRLNYGGASDGSLGTITLDVDYYKRYL
ncbi:choice-of-anchor R domain-containing protein [Methanoculleus sp.]|uniref:choice-of-anchor R domain-containing protein n=1 Tax=Methanoculleus sp. TaxID=90427 RepID=UPI0025D30FD1|nr:choice-of-anchor R domain-containing protein [Methanoculleus sp.]MCK9318901.1 phage tail family protein [Methanoculleus sp.]